MIIASALTSLSQAGSLSFGSPVNKHAQSVADAIGQAADAAAAKRKEMAEEKLKMLGERLRILMLFSAMDTKGNKGYAKSAAFIAKEIAQAVHEYVGEGNDGSTSDGQGLTKEDQAFLIVADQLSSQVKSIITAENQKAKRRHMPQESHQGAINEMDDAINQAIKSLGYFDPSTSVYSFNISISSFSIVA